LLSFVQQTFQAFHKFAVCSVYMKTSGIVGTVIDSDGLRHVVKMDNQRERGRETDWDKSCSGSSSSTSSASRWNTQQRRTDKPSDGQGVNPKHDWMSQDISDGCRHQPSRHFAAIRSVSRFATSRYSVLRVNKPLLGNCMDRRRRRHGAA